jgi:hydroxymethylglutaryl-CoA lyase
MIDGLPARVRITEVGPRDGLQNEARPVPAEAKAAYVRALVAAGLQEIELTSFVRADRVPQLADAEALCALVGPPPEGVGYLALTPNQKGLERALSTGILGKIAVFTAASETFNQRNVNATIAASLERFRPVATTAKAEGLELRGYISVALGCPYEGPIAPEKVKEVAAELAALGCDEVSIGDTIGVATPAETARALDAVLEILPPERLGLHLHDTRGMAVVNAMEGLRHGVAVFDASAGGLGGCPFAPGAAGNLATEDLVFLLDGLGIEHGADLDAVKRASTGIGEHLGHPIVSRVYRAPTWG